MIQNDKQFLLKHDRESRVLSKPKSWIFVSALLCLGVSVAAQADPEVVGSVIEEQSRTETAARASQERVAQLDEEASQMLSEYRQVTAEARSLEIYNNQLAQQVDSQEEEMRDIERQMLEIETTSREVIPLMQRMLVTLDQFVELDMPFLMEERRNRITNLKDIMRRADVTISEKYRRILEAYGVEMEYGRTIEAYRTELPTADEPITVDFLRIGRVALLYQSLDGQRTGYWNADRSEWVIDNSYQQAVRDGLRIANQQAAPNLIVAPVPSPKEAQL